MEEASELAATSPPGATTRGRLVALASAALVVAVNVAVQAKSAGFTDPDGYYHIRWSRILWEGLSHGQLPRFVWLPLTILNEREYADHHFLFHVLQIPFAWPGHLILGAKVSAVVFASVAYLSCFALVLRSGVRGRLVWIAALLASSLLVLARMGLPRAPALMLVLLVVAMNLLFRRRNVWLAVLSFVAVWTYSLFPILGVFAMLWAVATWIDTRRLEWRPVVAVAVGIAVGAVVNPYFPQNVFLFLAHLRASSPLEAAVRGTEWAPLSASGLFVLSPVAFVAQVTGVALVALRLRRANSETVFLGLASAALFALTLKSVRFVEYWAPLAVVFLAYAAVPTLAAWSANRVRAVAFSATVVMLSLVAGFVATTDVAALPSTHPDVYEGASTWLATNTPEGSLVYNVAWEDFPALFCFDPHNVYVAGLDPTYLSYEHPDLARLYDDIAGGRVAHPASVILDRFGARYVLVNVSSRPFLDVARTDPQFRLAYSNPFVAVLEITDAAPASLPSP